MGMPYTANIGFPAMATRPWTNALTAKDDVKVVGVTVNVITAPELMVDRAEMADAGAVDGTKSDVTPVVAPLPSATVMVHGIDTPMR